MKQPTTIDLANWMKQLSPLIKDWPLKKVVMPGTHDSAMYKGMLPADYAKNQNLDFTGQLNNGARYFDFRLGYFWKGAAIVPGAFYDPQNHGECWSCPPGYNRTWDSVSSSTACAKKGFGGISWFMPTSPATFHRKLKGSGLQYNDGNPQVAVEAFGNIIATDSPGYYMYGHGGPCNNWPTDCTFVVDVSLSNALGQIKSWIEHHPEEVVILNCTAKELDGNDPNLINLINSYLPNLVYDISLPPPQNATISDLKGKVVILGIGPYKSWLNNLKSIGYDGGIEDITTKMSKLDQDLNKERPIGTDSQSYSSMLEIQAQLTPSGQGSTGIPANPQDLAKKFNPLLASKLALDPNLNILSADLTVTSWRGRALNIISVDYIDISNVAENIIQANFYVPS